jgi:predicted dithiol-disulfide oxidoreductase (DUF899 family)
MWFPGEQWQCPGCTGFTSQFTRLEFLDSYDARFVIVTQGPIEEALAYKRRAGPDDLVFHANSHSAATSAHRPAADSLSTCSCAMATRVSHLAHSGRGTEQLSYTFALIDLLPYGRQEEWQDSPGGWPQSPAYSRWASSEDMAASYGPDA